MRGIITFRATGGKRSCHPEAKPKDLVIAMHLRQRAFQEGYGTKTLRLRLRVTRRFSGGGDVTLSQCSATN